MDLTLTMFSFFFYPNIHRLALFQTLRIIRGLSPTTTLPVLYRVGADSCPVLL